jgi:hypothetical protein
MSLPGLAGRVAGIVVAAAVVACAVNETSTPRNTVGDGQLELPMVADPEVVLSAFAARAEAANCAIEHRDGSLVIAECAGKLIALAIRPGEKVKVACRQNTDDGCRQLYEMIRAVEAAPAASPSPSLTPPAEKPEVSEPRPEPSAAPPAPSAPAPSGP